MSISPPSGTAAAQRRLPNSTWLNLRAAALALGLGLGLACTEEVDLGSTRVCAPAAQTCPPQSTSCEAPDPSVSEEIDLARNVTSPAHGWQNQPAGAFDGKGYLVTWLNHTGARGMAAVLGARTAASGEPIGRAFLISAFGPYVGGPAVAFNGTKALVVWPWMDETTSELRGARVGTDGALLDTRPISIATGLPPLSIGSIAAVCPLGSGFLVAWWQSGILAVTRVGSDGTILDSPALTISKQLTQANSQNVAVAFDGLNALVIWIQVSSDQRVVSGARISPEGVVLDPGGFAISAAGPVSHPAVSFNASEYLVAWANRDSTADARIYAKRVTPSGAVVDGTAIPVSAKPPGAVPLLQRNPLIAPDGDGYRVLWLEAPRDNIFESHLMGSRLSSAGTADARDISYLDTIDYLPFALVAGNGAPMLFYSQRGQVRGVPFDQTGLLGGDGALVGLAANSQDWTATSSGDGQFLAVWGEKDPLLGYSYWGTRLSDTGEILDSEGFLLHQGRLGSQPPEIVWNGRAHLLVWAETATSHSQLFAGEVDAAQPMLSLKANPLVDTSQVIHQVRLCFLQSQAMALWRTGDKALGQWIETDGRARGAHFEIAGGEASPAHWITAVSDGDQCLVAVITSTNVLTGFATASGEVKLEPLENVPVPPKSRVELAGRDGLYLLSWMELLPDGAAQNLRWARLDSDARLIDLGALDSGALPGFTPLAPDWSVSANGEGFLIVTPRANDQALFGVRIARSGGLLGAPFVLESKPTTTVRPSLATSPAGKLLVTYTRYDDSPPYLAPRARARLVDQRPAGETCRDGSECASGRCEGPGSVQASEIVGCSQSSGALAWPVWMLVALALKRPKRNEIARGLNASDATSHQ